MTEAPGTRDELKALLRTYNERPDLRDQIHKDIHDKFDRTLGIMVLDTSGFTRTTQLRGIVHFLAMIERLQRLVIPLLNRYGGRLLRTEADNIFAIFPDARSAVDAAVNIQERVGIANDQLPESDELYVSIGVGFGDVLQIGEDDLYGDQMNLACKLGEDLAQREEVLVTVAAYEALPDPKPWTFEELSFSISGLDLNVYRVKSQVD
jgi:adenylate cyclase